MDYRGIITQGYHIDAGGQNKIGIISKGYILTLAEIAAIVNIIAADIFFTISKPLEAKFTVSKTVDTKFTTSKPVEVKF